MTLLLFFERHGDVGVRAQAYDTILDIGDQAERDEVVVPFMGAMPFVDQRARILLGQLDAAALDVVDRADMDAVGADDFGMFLDLRCVDHLGSSFVTVACSKRMPSALDARRLV